MLIITIDSIMKDMVVHQQTNQWFAFIHQFKE